MPLRTVAEVMTTDVAVVDVETPFGAIVRLLAERRVTGAPVIDDEGHVLGVVSGIDLLYRAEHHKPATRWMGRRWLAREKVRLLEMTAAELMTAPVVTTRTDTVVRQLAYIMVSRSIGLVPVVDDEDRIVGVVTRDDVLGEFVVPDEKIRGEVLREVVDRVLWEERHSVTVRVDDGVVTLAGEVEHRSMVAVAVACTRNLAGVAGVVDHLTFATDDLVTTAIRPG